MKIFYFTSTGNCLALSKHFDAELYSIPHLLQTNELTFSDDKIGIIFPSYASATPRVVVEFLQKVKLNSPYIFAIATCGGGIGGTLNHFLKVANKNNINVSYANNLSAPRNYLRMFDMKPEVEGYDSEDYKKRAASLIDDVNNSVTKIVKGGAVEGAMGSMLYPFFNHWSKSTPKAFTVEEQCTLCKTCAKVCPEKNITVDKSVKFGKNCISCLACTQNCPQNAIRYKHEKSKARYRNPDVSLNEIIESNNRFI